MSPLQDAAAAPARRQRAPRPVYRTADGVRVPSVTTVLGVIAKPWLVPWANGLGLRGINSTDYVDETAGGGTLVHAVIEATLKGQPLTATLADDFTDIEREYARAAWRRFVEWRGGHELEPLLMEHQLVSERLRVGGTVDLYARVDGRLAVLDFKTSNRVYDSHLLQLAAYRSLLEEAGHQVDEVRVVLLPREMGARSSEASVTETGCYLEVFEAALELYRRQRVLEREERRRREHERQAVEKERVESDLQRMVEMSEDQLFARFRD